MNSFIGITINGKFKRTKVLNDVMSPMWNDTVRFRTKFYAKLELSEDIHVSIHNQGTWGDSELGTFLINPCQIR